MSRLELPTGRITATDWDRLGEVFDAVANGYRARPGNEAHAAAWEAGSSRCHVLAARAAGEDAAKVVIKDLGGGPRDG